MGGVDEGFPPRIDEVSPGMKRRIFFRLSGVCAVIADPVQPQLLDAMLAESLTSAAPDLRGLHYFNVFNQFRINFNT